jgi:predicted RNA binding protein YcfA (HicA-like mRNA interferase family)
MLRHLKQLGFKGPFTGGKHQFISRGSLTLTVPNPHKEDIGIGLIYPTIVP